MAQVDFLSYVPLLFWFIISFLIFYYLNLNYFLPLIFMNLKVKFFFFKFLHTFFFILNLYRIINRNLNKIITLELLKIYYIYIINLIK